MNNLALSVALATAPSSAFEALRERPRFWFPLLLLVASTVVMTYWYYSIVDFEWFKDLLFSTDANLRKIPEDERAVAMSQMTRPAVLSLSAVSAIFILPILLLLWSLFLLLAAKFTNVSHGFKHWFALSCWTTLPFLLSTVVAAILLIMSDTTQMSPSVLQPLSLNELVLHRPMGSPGFSLFESLSIPMVLSTILMIIGVHVWSRRSWAFSAVFALVPVVLFYGIWSFFAFR